MEVEPFGFEIDEPDDKRIRVQPVCVQGSPEWELRHKWVSLKILCVASLLGYYGRLTNHGTVARLIQYSHGEWACGGPNRVRLADALKDANIEAERHGGWAV